MLERIKKVLVCDIGGSTTDFALIENGHLRPSPSAVVIGGVLTNIQMPDTFSIAMGGGSIIDQVSYEFGAHQGSAAHKLLESSWFAGGSFLTLTDIAIANNPKILENFGNL